MIFRKKPIEIYAYPVVAPVMIHTLEGDMLASVGDWVITGVNGEKYPCKPDIFFKTYEPIDNEAKSLWNDIFGDIKEEDDFGF